MKAIVLATLLCLSLQILDRSYYDALCTFHLSQNFLWAQAKKIFEMLSEDYPRNTIQIETLDRDRDSKRSMLVSRTLSSLLDTLRWK